MTIDSAVWLHAHDARAYDLHTAHVNPAFAKMLRTIGFDKTYVRADGCYLWDAEGQQYLDLMSGWGVFGIGRNHPRVKARIRELLDADTPNLVGMNCRGLSGILAEQLAARVGGELSRVFFCNSGTEAIEGAIKFARCATARPGVIYCDHAFHGLTTGALSINGADFFKRPFGDLLPGTRRIPFNDLAALERELSSRQAAAFVVEPIQGKTCEVVNDGYLADAQRLCRKAGTLLVLDEVQTGLGRTGKWCCFHHWPGVEPDIVCLAKALSGGYVPVGAVVMRPAIMDAVFSSMDRCMLHSHTFGMNDLAMAAALATLQVIDEERMVERAAAMGDRLMQALRAMAPGCSFVSAVRGKGLMIGIDFARPAESLKLKAAWDTLHALHAGLFAQLVVIPLFQRHRILSQVAGYDTDVIKFLPPMTITDEDGDYFLRSLQDVLDDTLRVPGAAWDMVAGLARGAIAG